MLRRVVLSLMVFAIAIFGVTAALAAGASGLAKARSGAAQGQARPTHTAAPPTSPPPAGFSNEALWSSADDWEPNVALDPSSSYVYELTTRYSHFCSNGQGHCMVFRASSNGGTTWGADSLVCPCKQAQNDPVMKVATDGTIYQVHMNSYAVVFQKSSNHGATWSAPVDLKALSGLSFTDKPWIAISPSGQDVYIAFNSTDSYIAVSHDFGATFSAPVKTNSDALYWFAEGGVVAPNGNVYFSESAEQNAANPVGPIKLAVISSTNGGASWTTTTVDNSQQQPTCPVKTCPADFWGAQAAIAVDGAGTAMVVYAKSSVSGGPMSLYEATSTNGVTWTAPVALGSGGTHVGADFPAVAAGPTAGDFRVAWMDDRNGTTAFNVWYRSTANAGGSFSPQVRLSNLGTGAPYKTAGGFAFTYGDYFSMAVNATGKTYAIWGEGPSYAGPGGTWSTSGS
ncbi:MAG: hypothetical protein QOI81_762 [Actinomycetota bacterium]|nr:hypothetical protein [Actinomycetota bacterium]